MINKCSKNDFKEILEIINDAAMAYKGVIPEDRWKDPYMSEDGLSQAIENGVIFWGFKLEDMLAGVMGIQDVGDVTLIRHAYVKTKYRNQGIGSQLLKFLLNQSYKPILIGTWKSASWAVSFYKKHGFDLVSLDEKDFLLKKYWSIPDRQIETSVVLAQKDR